MVQRFQKRYLELLAEHDLMTKVERLHEQTSPLSRTQLRYFDKLCILHDKLMIQAERECRKLRMGDVDFTPEYSSLCLSLKFWKLFYKRKLGGRVHFYYLLRCSQKAGLTSIPFHLTVDETKEKYDEAVSLIRAYKRNSQNIQKKWLEDLATAMAVKGNTTKEKALKNLLAIEQQHRDARIINRVMKKLHASTLTKVLVKQPDGSIKECLTKDEIEEACIEEVRERFNQASKMPFSTQQMIDLVGKMGEKRGAQQILDGTFVCPPGIDPYVSKMIPYLKRHKNLNDLPPQELPPQCITTDAYINGWKKIKETTSASPGIHFGMCKAAARNPILARFEAQMLDIPYRSGYSPTPWKVAIDAMIEKKPGNFLWTACEQSSFYQQCLTSVARYLDVL